MDVELELARKKHFLSLEEKKKKKRNEERKR